MASLNNILAVDIESSLAVVNGCGGEFSRDLTDYFLEAHTMGNTQKPNKKFRSSLDIHTVIHVFFKPSFYMRIPYLHDTTGIDPHLGHEALRLSEVQRGVGEYVLMPNGQGHMAILRDTSQFYIAIECLCMNT
jgi:hypothetical protein